MRDHDEQIAPPSAPDTAPRTYQGAWRWNEDKTARLMSAEDWLEAEARVDEMLDSGKDRGGVLRAIAEEMRQIRARLTAQAVPPSAPDTKPDEPEHPEERCERCERPNVVWFTRNALWNVAVPDGGILCPVCFVQSAESRGIVPTGWFLVPESVEGDERIAEIRERLGNATPGPWVAGKWNHAFHDGDNVRLAVKRPCGEENHDDCSIARITHLNADADAQFIAHAPEDIAYLLSRLSSSPPEGEDTKRLDWLEKCTRDAIAVEEGEYDELRVIEAQHHNDVPEGEVWFTAIGALIGKPHGGSHRTGEGKTIRRAIDSARAAIPPQNRGQE